MSNWYARIVDGRQTGIESRRQAEDMARMSWVEGDMETGLSWTDADPAVRGGRRRFELKPISDDEAAAWRRRYPQAR